MNSYRGLYNNSGCFLTKNTNLYGAKRKPPSYGGDAKWACNLFIGEVLYLSGRTKMIEGKYYSAKQIWNAEGGFKRIDKNDVKAGDIAAFGGYHVEIVTKVTEEGFIFRNNVSFCSRGEGRGATDFGTERCNDAQRQMSSSNLKFLRVSQ